MRDAREVESQAPFKDLGKIKVDPKMVEIATGIIEQKEGKFEPATFKDPYEEALVDLLKRRARGAKPVHEAEEPEKPTNVVNLMDALRKSLGGKSGARRRRDDDEDAPKVVAFRKPAASAGSKPKTAGAKPKAKARTKPASRPAARRR